MEAIRLAERVEYRPVYTESENRTRRTLKLSFVSDAILMCKQMTYGIGESLHKKS